MEIGLKRTSGVGTYLSRVLLFLLSMRGTSLRDELSAARSHRDLVCPAGSLCRKFGWLTGYFRVPKTLPFKTRLSTKTFLWKCVLLAWEYKIPFISMASHLASLWNRGLGQLRKGLFLVLATTWQAGHVESQYNRIFSRRIYMKIEFSSQRREMLLFLSTNMAAMTSRVNQQF